MGEETKQVEATENQQTEANETKSEETQAKQMTFSQEQLDNIIKGRIESEKRKYDKILEEQNKAKEEAIKQKQIEEAKTKSDLEKVMQERISEKDHEIQKFKDMMAKEKIDNTILSAAGKYKAVSPEQVSALLKSEIKLSNDNRVEILDMNGNIRYNPKGELLNVEDRVKEFLDTNPHFRQGSLSGSGSQSSIEGKAVKPKDISEYNMSDPEDRKRYDAEVRRKRDSGSIKINLNN